MFATAPDHQTFVEAVARVGALDDELAEGWAAETLEVVGQRLGDREAALIAEDLPGPFGDALARLAFDGHFDLQELCSRVATRLRVDADRAREIVDAVCEVTGAAVTGDSRAHLETLPAELAALFEPRPQRQPGQVSPPPG